MEKDSNVAGPSGIKPKTQTVKRKKTSYISSSDDSSVDMQCPSSDEISDIEDTDCVECGEHYYSTKSKDDWIQCIVCNRWLHESCTMYPNMCNRCLRQKKRAENNK